MVKDYCVSHKVLPKCILKQFGDVKQTLYYIDCLNYEIKMSKAKVLNTEYGYFSKEIESEIGRLVETQIGKVISILKDSYISLLTNSLENIVLSEKHVQSIRNYLYALLIRSNNMIDKVKQGLLLSMFLSEQEIHDISFIEGFREAVKENFLIDFSLEIVFTREEKKFVLPSNGYCAYLYHDTEFLIVPLTGNIAACFTKGDKKHGGFYLIDNQNVNKLNKIFFSQQISSGEGFIACSNKEVLKELIENITYLK